MELMKLQKNLLKTMCYVDKQATAQVHKLELLHTRGEQGVVAHNAKLTSSLTAKAVTKRDSQMQRAANFCFYAGGYGSGGGGNHMSQMQTWGGPNQTQGKNCFFHFIIMKFILIFVVAPQQPNMIMQQQPQMGMMPQPQMGLMQQQLQMGMMPQTQMAMMPHQYQQTMPHQYQQTMPLSNSSRR